ncbi:MAG TPA: hypothetical protein VL572_00745 [Pyrinomonadaceae bacterium]|jgi:hypothetical protein|nr:hypothetical protein [Pyrinomonadaceae bacterium]
MNNAELLKSGRNRLLDLHKSLVDRERSSYESFNGPVTSGQFLNLLIEAPDFVWLRKFSTLIVDIDEMFAQKDGFDNKAVDVHLSKMREIVMLEGDDEDFVKRYRVAIDDDPGVAAIQSDLSQLLA